MDVNIREGGPADEARVVALWQACGLVASYNDPGTDYRFATAGECSAVLVAEHGEGGLIGSVMVGHDGHRGWLYYVAAAPEVRGQGVGRAVVAAGEQWLRDRHVPKVHLMVRETNTQVVQFYAGLGYEDMPRVLMAKWLNRPG